MTRNAPSVPSHSSPWMLLLIQIGALYKPAGTVRPSSMVATSSFSLVSISSTLTEAYDQISRGIIDGMFQNYTTVIDFNLARFMPNLFVLPGGFSASSQFMVVNERSWQRISEADRAAIDALSGEALVKRFSGIWQKNNMAAFDRLSAEGIKVHRIEGEQLEAMKTKLAVIEQQWLSEAKGVEAQEALNFYRAELDRVAAELGVPKD